MLIERWRRPSLLSSMRQHVTRLQFDSCAKKDSLCGTVMIHDGLNLRCLDQCHCVSSDGTSSSQSWRKRSVIRQSEFDPWVYTSLHPCFKPTWFMLHSVIEQPKLIAQMNEDWRWTRPSMLSSMCQDVARLQFDSCGEKDSLGGRVMIHDGLNLKRLDQCHGVCSHGTSSSQGWHKRIAVQSEFDPWVYILVSPKMMLSGLPRKSFSRKQAFVDINAFLQLRKEQPRFAQG